MTMNFREFHQNGRAWARRLGVETFVSEARFERAYGQLTKKYDSSRKAAIVATLFPCFVEKHGIDKKSALSLAHLGGAYLHWVCYHAEAMPACMSGVTPTGGMVGWYNESPIPEETKVGVATLLAKHREVFDSVVNSGLLARNAERARPPSITNLILNQARGYR